jgi:hypothetical protein
VLDLVISKVPAKPIGQNRSRLKDTVAKAVCRFISLAAGVDVLGLPKSTQAVVYVMYDVLSATNIYPFYVDIALLIPHQTTSA